MLVLSAPNTPAVEPSIKAPKSLLRINVFQIQDPTVVWPSLCCRPSIIMPASCSPLTVYVGYSYPAACWPTKGLGKALPNPSFRGLHQHQTLMRLLIYPNTLLVDFSLTSS